MNWTDPIVLLPDSLRAQFASEFPDGQVALRFSEHAQPTLAHQKLLHRVRAVQEDPATREQQRLRCGCNRNLPALYVRRGSVSSTLFLARMPKSGHLHDRDCWFYQSQFPDFSKEAIQTKPTDGDGAETTLLRTSFAIGPLKHVTRASAEWPPDSRALSPDTARVTGPKTSVNLAEFLAMLVQWSGINVWRRNFKTTHRFEVGSKNPFSPLLDRIRRRLRSIEFSSHPESEHYVKVGRGIFTEGIAIPSSHIRVDVIRTITRPQEGRQMGQLRLFGAGHQTFFLPPHLVTQSLQRIERASLRRNGSNYEAEFSDPDKTVYFLVTAQIEAIETQRSRCFLRVARMELLPISHLGIPVFDPVQHRVVDRLVRERRDFVRPLVRDEETEACGLPESIPFVMLGLKPDLHAGEIASSKRAEDICHRYRAAGRAVELLSPTGVDPVDLFQET